LTSSSGTEALKLLEQNEVHMVISDQRMPEMSGTEFLAIVKEQYPDAIRIILTGYTELDSITQSINKGHVYKLLLKPWNDQNLKLEVKQALEQYDLVQANKHLHERVLQQNEELRRINENLEELVQRRTKDLEIHNRALEFSRAVLYDLPMPIVGVGVEGTLVLMNQAAQDLSSQGVEMGGELVDSFSTDVQEKVSVALETNVAQTLNGYKLSQQVYDIDFIPLSGTFEGKSVVMKLEPVED
jgi:response regulator RpfG family c-di-GMP phosphodiesterase